MKKQSEYYKKKLRNDVQKFSIVEKEWHDIRGIVYNSKTEAQISSFMTIIWNRLKFGFPVVLPRFWYNAIAIWPLIFIRRDSVVTPRLNHEMIHIRQQVEMFVVFAYVWYFLEAFIRFLMYWNFKKVYEKHSMEREAKENETNVQYLLAVRKPYAFIKYLW